MPIVAAADCIRVEVVVEEKGDGTRGLDLRERRRRLLLERAAGPAFGLIDGTGAVVEDDGVQCVQCPDRTPAHHCCGPRGSYFSLTQTGGLVID